MSLNQLPPNLRYLNIAHNRMHKISEVNQCKVSLTYFNFGWNKFNVNPFETVGIENVFPNLEYCYAFNKNMEPAVFVERLPQLVHMNIFDSGVRKRGHNVITTPTIFSKSLKNIDIFLLVNAVVVDATIWEKCPRLQNLRVQTNKQFCKSQKNKTQVISGSQSIQLKRDTLLKILTIGLIFMVIMLLFPKIEYTQYTIF